MGLRLNKKLNIVIPIYDAENDEKIVAYVHSTPISAEVFDAYFLPISKTFAFIYSQGLGHVAGPRVADKLLRTVSQDLKIWDGPEGVKAGLVEEIYRLTTVLHVGDNGWEMKPFALSKKLGILSVDDAAEVDAALVFFTVNSAMHRKSALMNHLDIAMSLWGALVTSQTSTEYLNFLTTSTAQETTGEKKPE